MFVDVIMRKTNGAPGGGAADGAAPALLLHRNNPGVKLYPRRRLSCRNEVSSCCWEFTPVSVYGRRGPGPKYLFFFPPETAPWVYLSSLSDCVFPLSPCRTRFVVYLHGSTWKTCKGGRSLYFSAWLWRSQNPGRVQTLRRG